MKNLISLIFLTITFIAYGQNAPVANDQSITVNEGATLNGTLTGSDADSDGLAFSIVGNPTSGTVTVQSDGSFSYVHNGGEGSSDSFTFSITDDSSSQLVSNTATVTITITAINDNPVVADISKTIDEGASAEINVSGTDAEGAILEYEIVSAPSNGTFTLNATTGVGYYSHNGSETTTDSVVVRAKESTGSVYSSNATITITINAVNDSPNAPDGTVTLDEGSTSQSTPFGATDAEGSSLTINVSSQGSNGTAVVNGADFVYTHDGSETTSDTFSYSVSDGTLSSTGTITVTINPTNDAPTGVADTYYVTRNSTTEMSAEIGVLRNDSDSDTDSSLFTVSNGNTNTQYGQLTLNPDGSFTYVTDGTNTSFNSDSFSYTVSDGSATSSEVTVTLEVADIIPVPNSYSNNEGATLTVDATNGVVTNDVDPNGLALSAAVVTNPSYGTLTLNTDGSFSYVHDGTENRKDTFTYKLTNANNDESKSTFVVINNTNVNDAPTSTGTTFTLNEGASNVFTPTYADTDTQLSGITFSVTADVSNGVLSDNGNGTFTYIHNGGETNSDTFTYSVSDGEFTVENISGAITVTAVNDVPTATDLTYTIDEATSTVVAFAGTDAEGSSLSFAVLTNPSNGTLTTSNGVTTYTHNGSETTSDSFTYQSFDGTAQSSAGTVSITLNPVNSAPIVSAVAFTIDEDASTTFNLGASSTEPEGQTMTYAISNPTNGTASVNSSTGEVSYDHDGSETTTDTFTFTATDSDGLASSAGTITVTLNPVNDAPVIGNATLNLDQYDQLTFSVPGTDAEGSTLTYTIVTNPTQGTLEDNGSGSYTYYNDTSSNINGSTTTDTFVVKANDGTVDSANKTLTFTIAGIDQSLPQIILTSSTTSLTETNSGGTTLAINAVLVDNSFYSTKRDMDATPVAVGADNSLGYKYLGEYGGHKYYYKSDWKTKSEAQADAIAKGGYLWVIESTGEETAVKNLMSAQSLNEWVWLGLAYDYAASPQAWKWINGHDYTGYTNWNGQYDDDTDSSGALEKPVARMYTNSNYWQNVTINDGARYIIEFDNNVSAGSNITFDIAATGSSTATVTNDYTLSASSLTIAKDSSSATLTVTEVADTTDEPSETIILQASNVSTGNARIKSSQNSLTVSLVDNENTSVVFSTPKTTYAEADGDIVMTATLNNVKPFDTAITLALNGTATVDQDYSTDDDGYLEGIASGFSSPEGLVQSTAGDYYVAEERRVYKVAANGTKTSFAGNGNYGNYYSEAQPLSQARFRNIGKMVIDKASARSASGSADVIYLYDERVIRKIDLGNNLIYYITGSTDWTDNFVDGTLAQAKFRSIRDITLSNNGNILYVIDENAIRAIDLANNAVSTIAGNRDWGFQDGTLSASRFEGPQGIAMDSSGDLIVRQYGKLRKIDIDGNSVTTLLENDWSSGDVFIDSSDNVYFASEDRHNIFKYSSTGEVTKIIDSQNDSGTVDGVLKNAKIDRPMDIILNSAGDLVFVERNSTGSLRKIDFVNKLRIPAGQQTGTFTLNINDDGSYENDETISVVVSSAESIDFTANAEVLGLTIESDDSAPEVQLVSADSNIAEEGGSTVLTFQLGDAAGSGARQDMSSGLKGDYEYLGAIGTHKYYMSYDNRSWTEARDIASDLGGYLVVIDDATENQWIRDKMSNAGYNWASVWIGYNDAVNEGIFEWVNGSDSTYQNWSGGEPNNSGGEDYAELMSNGKWNDNQNEAHRYYVIEFSGTVSSLPTVITYTATESETGEFTYPTVQDLTIPAGSSKATLTVSAKSDTDDEGSDSITYTITGVTNGTIGSKNTTTVTIDDNDLPTATIDAISDSTIAEKSGELVITARIANAKTFESSLGVTINQGGSDTAVFGTDFEITELNNVSTLAGSGTSNYSDGTGDSASFSAPGSIVSDSSGNLYVADGDNNVIRKVTMAGVVTTFAGNGNWAHDRETGFRTDVGFARPRTLVFNSAGELFVFEEGRHRISKIDTSGNVTRVIGDYNGSGWGDNDGDKTQAQFSNIYGMAFDSSGNLFVTDSRDGGKIKKITFDPGSGDATSTTFAGTGNWGEIDGPGNEAEFRNPGGIVIDANDIIYVADRHNHKIRKITTSGEVSTFAGNGYGDQDGSLLNARFQQPFGMSSDASGDIYIAESDGNRIRKIDISEGSVSTVAGTGTYGHLDSSLLSSQFKRPEGVLATTSAIYIADTDNHRIRQIELLPSIKIPAGSTSGTLTLKGVDDFKYESDETATVSISSYTNLVNSSIADISATVTSEDAAPIVRISVVDDVLDEQGAGTTTVNVSLSDVYSSSKVDMSPSDKADYYYLGAHNGSKYYASKNNEHLNFDEAKARAAALGGQLAILTSSGEQETVVNGIYAQDPEFSADNNIWLNHWIGYYLDDNENWVWNNTVTSDYENWTDSWQRDENWNREAGYLHTNGLWHSSEKRSHRRFVVEFSSAISDFNTVVDISFADTNSSGTTLEGTNGADFSSNLTDGKLTISAGNPSGSLVLTAVDDSTDESIEKFTVNLDAATGATVDTDPSNNSVDITINDDELTTVTLAVKDGVSTISEVDGQATLEATLTNAKLNPVEVNLAFADSGNLVAIFGQDYDSSDLNAVSTFVGSGNSGYLDGDADDAEFSNEVRNMISDSSGNIYVADKENRRIRKIDPQGNVTTYNNGSNNWETELNGPSGMAFDGSGNMYVAESWANRISKVDASGNVTRFANQDGQWGSNNGDVSSEVTFEGVEDIVFDSQGNLFVLENHRIRKIEFSGDAAVASDFVGNGNWGDQDGTGTEVRLGQVRNLVIDSNDNLYYADGAHQRIKKVTPEGVVTTIAGNGNWDYADGFGTNAKFRQPHSLAIDSNDNIYVSDRENNRIRKIELQADGKYKVSTVAGNGNYGYVDGSADQAEFKQVTSLLEFSGILYAYDRDEYKFRKLLLNPVMSIPAGSTTASFNISGIDDTSFESTETIKVTPTASGANLASSDALELSITSDERMPKVVIKSSDTVLDENAGTLSFDVILVDAAGAAANWTNTELPTNAESDFDFMGEFDGHKYYFSRSRYTWAQAKQNALDLGGQMLVIDDAEENEFVSQIMIYDGTWIGHSRPTEADSWTNIYGDVNYTNWAHVNNGGNVNDLTGYALTYGNEWYNHDQNDSRHFILEYGPVASSELESSVLVEYSGDATIGNGNDYTTSSTIATIPAGSQKTIITLTGLDDDLEEPIEEINMNLALRFSETEVDEDGNPKSISNVELGDTTSLDVKISDDEEPVISFETSSLEISENGGSVTVTANLSNAKMNESSITFSLEGTSTKLVDYSISSILTFKNFAGSKELRGTTEGQDINARFDSPVNITPYLDGSFLVHDMNASLIKKVDKNGYVTNFLGKPYQQNTQEGDANDVGIYMPWDMSDFVADLSSGDVYWTSWNQVFKFENSSNTISKIYENDGAVSGLTILNNELYFSDRDHNTINKLVFDGSSFSSEVVIGRRDNGGYHYGEFQMYNFSDDFPLYPGELVADQVNNRIYVNFYQRFNEDQYRRARMAILDFNTSTWQFYAYNILPQSGHISSFAVDESSGTLFVISNNELRAIDIDEESGFPFVSGSVEIPELGYVYGTSVIGSNLYVADSDYSTIGRISLGASIEIPAGQTSNNITFSAFKDPWFENNEVIDIGVASIENGTSDSNDISDVTIIESTRLELVADAPFEGVENGKVSWGDFDRDGDMDLALMGSAASGTITNVYENIEGTFSNTSQNFTKFIGGDIEFVDVNQDGWLDVAVSGTSPDGRKSELYINQSGQFFELNPNYNVEGLSQTDMEWADLDNDSDPDLIISGIDNENQFRTYYYTNLGDFNFLKEKLFNRPGFISGEIDIVDANNDGDNDLFATGIAGSIGNQYYDRFRIDNTYYWGSQQSDVDTGFAAGNTEYLDIDGDGLMDFLSIGKDDINSSAVRSYSNLMDLNYLPKLNNADFDFADYNNDGLSDVVISGEDPSDGTAVSKLYVTFADYFGSDYQLVETDLVLQGLRESSVDWIDYDKDGDLDLFLTGLDNDGNAKSLLYKATNTNNLNTPPAKVENVVAQGLGGNGLLRITWDKPTDDYSTSFRYNVRIGTSPGSSDILYANSITDADSSINGSTLIDVNSLSSRTNRFLTVLPGTYYVAVQAIDGGNRGGEFSDEVSVSVDYAWNLQRLGGIIDRRLRTSESSSIKFIDIDKDGDKDLIGSNIGTNDFGQSALNVFLFQNDIFEPIRGYYGGVSTIEVADFNKDGNEDVIIAVEENQGTRIYLALNTFDQDEERTDGERDYFRTLNPFDGDNLIESVYNVKFAIKDLDNDGLVEVIVAGESSKISSEATAEVGISTIQPFNDDGSVGFDAFNLSYPQSIGDDQLSSLSFISYDFGDVDNDSDYDFLISGYSFEGYKTILYENKRKLDENGAVVQPIEVYFEETTNNFTSVKEGTTQFVDFDSDGKVDIIFSGQSAQGDIFRAYKNTGDINNFASVDLGLPAVRNGKFKFGDMFGQGRNDVVFSGTVSGQGTFSRIAYYDADTFSYVESNYDLFLDDADIGMADFDGDLDTDIVLTGKWNGDPTSYNYHGYVYINVRGFEGDGGVVNNNDSNIKTSSVNGLRTQSSTGSSGSGSSLNTRPDPPTTINIQRQRLAEDSFEVVLSWNSGTDAETPDEGLTYSLKIGTTDGGEEILASGSNAEGVRNTGSKGNAENNKSWKLVLPTGTYYAAVQSVDASFIGSQFSGTKEFTVASSYKLGDSNGDDTVNILDLTSNVDYILGTTPTVFVTEVADVNGDGEINVADISGIVNIIMNDGAAGVARGSEYDPYNWEYFSHKPVGEATLIRRDGRIYLENDKPVTSLQFTIDSTVEYELNKEMDNVTVVNFVEDGKRTFLMYSFNNQPIDELTDVIFDYLDLNDGDDFEIRDMTAGTKDGLILNLKYSDESFFDGSENIIQIYPNPAVSNVNLLTDITKKVETIEVDVFNVLGVSVYKTKIDAIGRLNDLDVSMLSSGVYTVRVRMITGKNEEIINVHKLIKK
jgi:VCBS repeat-containing protein